MLFVPPVPPVLSVPLVPPVPPVPPENTLYITKSNYLPSYDYYPTLYTKRIRIGYNQPILIYFGHNYSLSTTSYSTLKCSLSMLNLFNVLALILGLQLVL